MRLGRRALVGELGRLGTWGAKTRVVPDLSRMAHELSVREIRLEKMKPAGQLTWGKGGFIVVLRGDRADSLRPPASLRALNLNPRQRFTLAHELAHILVYRYYARSRQMKGARHSAALASSLEAQEDGGAPRFGAEVPRRPGLRSLERLCNYLAGQILLPSWVLKEKLKDCERVDRSVVLRLGRAFSMSPEAVVRRLAQAEEPLRGDWALLFAEQYSSRSEPCLRAYCMGEGFAARVGRPRRCSLVSVPGFIKATLPPNAAASVLSSGILTAPVGQRRVPYPGFDLLIRKVPASDVSTFFLEMWLQFPDDRRDVELCDDKTLPLWVTSS